MSRHRGQKALYEVIGKTRSRRTAKAEPLRTDTEGTSKPASLVVGQPLEARWLRPRPVQFYAGRIELTLSYPVLALCLLTLLAGFLAVYRLGLWRGAGTEVLEPAVEPPAGPVLPPSSFQSEIKEIPGNSPTEEPSPEATPDDSILPPAPLERGNAIGIISYRNRTQLVPLRDYFTRNGIPAEIRRVENGFQLVTTERFREDPARPGTDGYVRLQQVIELGAKYRPPPNSDYLGFNRESFEGAHGVLLE